MRKVCLLVIVLQVIVLLYLGQCVNKSNFAFYYTGPPDLSLSTEGKFEIFFVARDTICDLLECSKPLTFSPDHAPRPLPPSSPIGHRRWNYFRFGGDVLGSSTNYLTCLYLNIADQHTMTILGSGRIDFVATQAIISGNMVFFKSGLAREGGLGLESNLNNNEIKEDISAIMIRDNGQAAPTPHRRLYFVAAVYTFSNIIIVYRTSDSLLETIVISEFNSMCSLSDMDGTSLGFQVKDICEMANSFTTAMQTAINAQSLKQEISKVFVELIGQLNVQLESEDSLISHNFASSKKKKETWQQLITEDNIPSDFDWKGYSDTLQVPFPTKVDAWIYWIENNCLVRSLAYLSASSSLPYMLNHAYNPTTILPVAINFPQFHNDETNSKIWHEGWTDFTWLEDMVDPIANQAVLRPEWGYYDLLNERIRHMQAVSAKEHGVYGFAYYHYYFSGKLVLDKVLNKILEDGEPNIPFYFIWANEPWTKKWWVDESDGTFLSQTYAESSWKGHLDYLIPFFQHKNYMKVGNKPMFAFTIIGDILDSPLGDKMLDYYNKRAQDAGFDGIYFIQLYNIHSKSNVKNSKVSAGAAREPGWAFERGVVRLLERPTHLMLDNTTRDDSFVDTVEILKQISLAPNPTEVFFRGGYPCWDNTPRIHGSRNFLGLQNQPYAASTIHLNRSPLAFYIFLVRQFENIEQKPNPPSVPNYFLINAWNEWGEGNALEPNTECSDCFLNGVKYALETHRCSYYYKVQIKSGDLSRKMTYLIITHVGGGGVERHTNEMFEKFGSQINFIVLKPDYRHKGRFRLYEYAADWNKLDSQGLPISYCKYNKYYYIPEELDSLKKELRSLPFMRIHVHHLLGFTSELIDVILNMGIPIDVTLHDFLFLHPGVGELAAIKVENSEDYETNYKSTWTPESRAVIAKSHLVLENARRILAPSLFVKNVFLTHMPHSKAIADIIIAHHMDQQGVTYVTPKFPKIAFGEPLKILAYGNFEEVKNPKLITEVALLAARHSKPIKIITVGTFTTDDDTSALHRIHSEYKEEELLDLIKKADAHVLWFASKIETYSYTLTKGLQIPLPIVASNNGALKERLIGRPLTWLRSPELPAEDYMKFFLSLRSDLFRGVARGNAEDLNNVRHLYSATKKWDDTTLHSFDYNTDYLS